ncbi:hypothetical protein H1C71_000332 [Ictidomys tridecemlineatus]|nr:hypothetical protein H1C71_000332 [Ictidomys tridecemlineatus]
MDFPIGNLQKGTVTGTFGGRPRHHTQDGDTRVALAPGSLHQSSKDVNLHQVPLHLSISTDSGPRSGNQASGGEQGSVVVNMWCQLRSLAQLSECPSYFL